jgi:hypothetical protein
MGAGRRCPRRGRPRSGIHAGAVSGDERLSTVAAEVGGDNGEESAGQTLVAAALAQESGDGRAQQLPGGSPDGFGIDSGGDD